VIVADTSAIISVLAYKPRRTDCERALLEAEVVAISAATLLELSVVANGRGVGDAMLRFLEAYDLEVVPVTESTAWIASEAYLRWGKGFHPAALNFGDCFSYALAKERDWPLLFIGNDFSLTDLRSVL
jgi:ribonuclease VapC